MFTSIFKLLQHTLFSTKILDNVTDVAQKVIFVGQETAIYLRLIGLLFFFISLINMNILDLLMKTTDAITVFYILAFLWIIFRKIVYLPYPSDEVWLLFTPFILHKGRAFYLSKISTTAISVIAEHISVNTFCSDMLLYFSNHQFAFFTYSTYSIIIIAVTMCYIKKALYIIIDVFSIENSSFKREYYANPSICCGKWCAFLSSLLFPLAFLLSSVF